MATASAIKRWVRRLLAAVIVAVCLLAVFVLVLQTPLAKNAIAGMAADLITEHTAYSLRVEGLTGTLPHHIRAAAIEVGDADGPLVSLHDLELRLALWPLLRGRIHLPMLTLSHLEVWRRPEPSERWQIPRLPALPAWPTIDQLRIDRITLDEAVVGAPASLTVSGTLRPAEGWVFPDVELDAQGLDAAGISASLRYAFDAGAPRLSFVLEDEQLLPVLLDVAPPVSVDLSGKGDRADWHAALMVKTGDATVADGTLQITEADDTTLEAAITAHMAALPMLRPHAELTGDPVNVQLAATLDRTGTLNIAAARIASNTMDGNLRGMVDFEQARMDVLLEAAYDDAGRLPGLPPQPTPTPLRLEASAEGPFNALGLHVGAFASDEQMLDADITLQMNDTIAAEGTARVTPPTLARDLFPMLPETDTEISFAASYAEDTGILQLPTLEVAGAGLTLSAQGSLTPAQPAFDMTCALTVEDLQNVGALLPLSPEGAFQATLNVRGNEDGLTATASAEVKGLHVAPVQLTHGHIEIVGACEDWFTVEPSGIQLDIAATTTALQGPMLTPVSVTLQAALAASTLEEIHLASLSLSDDHVTLTGEGRFDLAATHLDAHIAVDVPNCQQLPLDVADLPEGALRLETTAQGTVAPLAMDIILNGDLREIGALPEPVTALVGEALRFEANTTLQDDRFTVKDLLLSGTAFDAQATGTYTFPDALLESELQLRLPDASTAGNALGQPVTGALALDATVAGALPHLDVNAQIDGKDLAYNAGPPLQAQLTLSAHNVPAEMEATVTGTAHGHGETVALDMRAGLTNNTLSVPAFSLVAGENRVSGTAAYALDTGAPEAQLNAELNDLARLAALAGIELSGTVEAAAQLDHHAANATLAVRDFRYGNLTLGTLETQLDVQHLWQTPEAHMTTTIHALSHAPVTMDRIAVVAAGGMGALELTVDMEGLLDSGTTEPQPITCAMTSRVNVMERSVETTRLEGTAGIFGYELDAPALLSASDEGLAVAPLTVRVGDGAIHLDALYEPEAVRGALRFESLPLPLSGLLMEPAVLGTLAGTVRLSGAPDAPILDIALQLADVAPDIETADALTPLSVALEARLADGQAAANLDARMDDVATVEARGSVPLVWQLQPWMLDMPPAAPVAATLEVDVLFATLPQALGLVEHHLDARLTGTFELAGTVDAPRASGDAYIRDGRYENTVTGTQLHDVNLHVRADGDAVRIEECSARTGRRGDLTAEGGLQLLPADRFPFEAQIHFNDAELARLDYMTARVNGVVTATGDLNKTTVAGELDIGPVHATMPDQMPVSEPTVIDVVEVKDGKEVMPPEPATAHYIPEVHLDIRCNIPGRVYVRAPILDSEWGGRLAVGGLLTEPRIEGRISVLRGHMDFLGRRFQLRDSAITFPGGPPTAFLLDMRARAETPTLTALLELTGPMDDVQLNMRSEPPLPQDEVLAHVLFGRDLSRITPVQAIQLARVAAMFNQSLGGMQLFSGNVGLPGIDRIDIRTGERADETVVGMGRYFTDSVYVEVEQGTTTDSGKVSVEVEVSPQVSVKGDVDAAERSGIGVFWRRDY